MRIWRATCCSLPQANQRQKAQLLQLTNQEKKKKKITNGQRKTIQPTQQQQPFKHKYGKTSIINTMRFDTKASLDWQADQNCYRHSRMASRPCYLVAFILFSIVLLNSMITWPKVQCQILESKSKLFIESNRNHASQFQQQHAPIVKLNANSTSTSSATSINVTSSSRARRLQALQPAPPISSNLTSNQTQMTQGIIAATSATSVLANVRQKWRQFDRSLSESFALTSDQLRVTLQELIAATNVNTSNTRLSNHQQVLSSQCKVALSDFLDALGEQRLWASQLLDSTARLPSGILEGTLTELGNFDECLALRQPPEVGGLLPSAATAPSPVDPFNRGQYCTVLVKPPLPLRPRLHTVCQRLPVALAANQSSKTVKLLSASSHQFYYVGLRLGLCTPSRCSQGDVQLLLSKHLSKYELIGQVKSCQTAPVFTGGAGRNSISLENAYNFLFGGTATDGLDVVQQCILLALATILLIVLLGTLLDTDDHESEARIHQLANLTSHPTGKAPPALCACHNGKAGCMIAGFCADCGCTSGHHNQPVVGGCNANEFANMNAKRQWRYQVYRGGGGGVGSNSGSNSTATSSNNESISNLNLTNHNAAVNQDHEHDNNHHPTDVGLQLNPLAHLEVASGKKPTTSELIAKDDWLFGTRDSELPAHTRTTTASSTNFDASNSDESWIAYLDSDPVVPINKSGATKESSANGKTCCRCNCTSTCGHQLAGSKLRKCQQQNYTPEKQLHHQEKYQCKQQTCLLVKLICCFSLKRNLHTIGRNRRIGNSPTGSDGESMNDIKVIHGLRTLTMVWIIFGHTIGLVSPEMMNNLFSMAQLSCSSRFLQAILNATLAVNTFFMISGLVTVLSFARKCKSVLPLLLGASTRKDLKGTLPSDHQQSSRDSIHVKTSATLNHHINCDHQHYNQHRRRCFADRNEDPASAVAETSSLASDTSSLNSSTNSTESSMLSSSCTTDASKSCPHGRSVSDITTSGGCVCSPTGAAQATCAKTKTGGICSSHLIKTHKRKRKNLSGKTSTSENSGRRRRDIKSENSISYCNSNNYDESYATSPITTTNNLLPSDYQPFSWLLMRYLRLTPTYATIIGVSILMPSLSSGPFWLESVNPMGASCRQNWWLNLLYVNNFVNTDRLCLIHSWYLSNDWQFFILSLLLLGLCYKSSKLAAISVFTLLVGSSAATFAITVANEFPPTIVTTSPAIAERWQYIHSLYYKPWPHLPSYLIGMLVGYAIVTKCKQTPNSQSSGGVSSSKKTGNMSSGWRTFMWIFSTLLACALLNSIYPWNMGLQVDPLITGLHSATFRTLWAACCGWLVFGLVTNPQNSLAKFLSWHGFQITSRLTYCAYLVHPLIIYYHFGTLRERLDSSPYGQFNRFASTLLLSYLLALLVALLIEGPSIQMQQFLSKPREQVKTKKENKELPKIKPRTNSQSSSGASSWTVTSSFGDQMSSSSLLPNEAVGKPDDRRLSGTCCLHRMGPINNAFSDDGSRVAGNKDGRQAASTSTTEPTPSPGENSIALDTEFQKKLAQAIGHGFKIRSRMVNNNHKTIKPIVPTAHNRRAFQSAKRLTPEDFSDQRQQTCSSKPAERELKPPEPNKRTCDMDTFGHHRATTNRKSFVSQENRMNSGESSNHKSLDYHIKGEGSDTRLDVNNNGMATTNLMNNQRHQQEATEVSPKKQKQAAVTMASRSHLGQSSCVFMEQA